MTGKLDLPPGEQALVPTDGAVRLSALPPAAMGNLLVVSVTRTPSRLERAVREAGGDPSAVGAIPVSGSRPSYDGPLWATDPVDPSDLTGISMRFSEAARYLQPDEGWLVVDNLNVLLMYAPPDSVYRLVTSFVETSREERIRGVYGIVEDALDPETRERFRALVGEGRPPARPRTN